MHQEVSPDTVATAEIDDVWIRIWRVPAGGMVPQHAHEHDHMTVLIAGTMKIWDGGSFFGVKDAPAIINIKAGSKHSFYAVTEIMVQCIHNLRGTGLEEPRIESEHDLSQPVISEAVERIHE